MLELITIILFAGLLLLGLGYFVKKKEGKFLNIIGYLLFGSYWLMQVPHFIIVADYVNALFCAFALPFFAYIAYHEFLSFKYNEDPKHLRFLAGWLFFAGFIYFLIEKIPFLTAALIKICADQSVWLINLFGYNYSVGQVVYFPEISFPILPTNQGISLILACTGIQSILIFLGAIICIKAALKRRFYALLATAPVIWLLNLVRNAGIIYGDSIGVDANFAHNYLGKLGALLALLALAFIVFKLLPELYTNIIALLELPKRKLAKR